MLKNKTRAKNISNIESTLPPEPPVVIPFDYDADTYWYNFNTNNSNTVSSFAFNSLSFSANKVNQNNRFLFQTVKDFQPFYTNERGISFGNTTGRFLTLYPLPGFNQNKSGTFFACNVYTSGFGTLLTISSFEIAGGRGRFNISSSLKPEIRLSNNGVDGNTLTLIKTATNALQPNRWYTLGFLVDRENDICKIYVNGVVVDTSTIGTPYSNTDDFKVKNVIVGADGIVGATGTTFDGILAEMIFQDSLDLALLTTQLDYLQLSKFDVPDAPQITVNTGSTSVYITFNAPNSHNVPITDYQYQYKLSSSSTWIDFSESVSNVTDKVITGLTNDSLYDFRVRAINSIGISAWSSSVAGTPTANPGPPNAVELSIIPVNNQVTLSYVQPGTNGYNITGYKNYYKESSSGIWILFNTTTTPGTIVTGLTNNISYDFSVIATNSQGNSVRSNIESGTPGITTNMQNVVASCVMDIDFRHYPCYNGTGNVLNNLVLLPADGALQTDYNLYLGDGVTGSTYPTFSGVAGTTSAVFTFDGGDFLTLVNSINPPAFKNAHKTVDGSALTILVFFENLPDIVTGSPTIFSTRNVDNDKGLTAYLNTSEFSRATQRGNGGTGVNPVNFVPSMSLGCSKGVPAWVGFGFEINSTQIGGSRQTFWNNALGANAPATTNNSYDTVTDDAAQKMNFFRRGPTVQNIIPNGMRLKAIYAFNTRLTNTQIASVVTEASARHGVTY